MEIFVRYVYSLATAVLTMFVLAKFIPKLKKQDKMKHIIVILFMSLFMMFYDVDRVTHVLCYYGSLILILKWLYQNSSFVASMSVLFLYIITLLSSMISANLSVMLLSESVDYRALFLSGLFMPNFLFALSVLLFLEYYQIIVKLFKKVAGTHFKFDVVMILSNVVLFALVIAYQRLTFINMIEFSAVGIINTPETQGYNGYFLLTYAFITCVSLAMVVLINRLFIVDKNLERYKIKAETDIMTGALSREAGLTHLKNEMSQAIAYKHDLTIAYFDVNDLKVVNDKWGHKEGDKLIQTMTEIVQSKLREFDIVARLGGDEFLIVFARCNKQQAQRVWRRITEEFLRVNAEGDFPFKISASVGIAQFNPVKHKNLMLFVHEADAEMYVQKKSIKASLL